MKSILTHHIDFNRINSLLESFNAATGFVTAIIDLDGNVLSQSGWRSMCTQFHRKNSETAERCQQSDTELSKRTSHENKFHFYKCLNGLIDVAVPLIINGEHIANLFTGQFFFEKPDVKFFKNQSKQFGFEEKSYLKALNEIPIVSKKDAENAINFLQNMTSLISEISIQKHEQKKLNVAIIKSEEKFKNLMQQAPFVVEIYDLNGLQIAVNNSYETLWGFSAETTLNKFNVLKSNEVVETGLINYVKRAYRGESVDVPEYSFNSTGTTEAKGHGRTRWLETRIYPLKDELGEVTNIVIVHHDISERKETEIVIKRSEKRFRLFVQQIPVALCHANHKTDQIIYLNNRFIQTFGYTVDEIPNQDVWLKTAYPNNEYRLWVTEHWSRTLKTAIDNNSEIQPYTYNVVCKNKETKQISISGIILGDEVLITFIDLTDEKNIENELRKHKEHLEELVKERTNELEIKLAELDRMNKLFVGRELRMVELKEKIIKLEKNK